MTEKDLLCALIAFKVGEKNNWKVKINSSTGDILDQEILSEIQKRVDILIPLYNKIREVWEDLEKKYK